MQVELIAELAPYVPEAIGRAVLQLAAQDRTPGGLAPMPHAEALLEGEQRGAAAVQQDR
jgi:hypothetical protein